MYDSDTKPMGNLIQVLFTMALCIILFTVFCSIVASAYSQVTPNDNGDGCGLPLGSADSDTSTTIYIQNTNNQIVLTGDYSGTFNMDDNLFCISDKQAIYVHNGSLHYFNGVADTVVSTITLQIAQGHFNGSEFNWLYYPSENGEYRAYPDSIQFVNDTLIAMGVHGNDVIISADNRISNDNIDSDVTVIVNRTHAGVNSIVYGWKE